MSITCIELQERRRWRLMFPLLAEPRTAGVCLEDGEGDTILELFDISGHLAYLVQMGKDPMRFILATDLDSRVH
jgi:hypothetical protein